MAITGAIKKSGYNWYYGDMYSFPQPGPYVAEDDFITGTATAAGTNVSGDMFWNKQGHDGILDGGDDTINVSAKWTSGDAYYLYKAGSTVNGGNDVITMLDNTVDTGTYYVTGDVSYSRGDVFGGDDTITAFRGETLSGHFHGDIRVIMSGWATGGNDTIEAADAADYVFGDYHTVYSSAIVTGGNDVLHGHDGNDYLYGDASVLSGTMTFAGDDIIYGGAGDDTIYGDVATQSGSLQTAGADTIDGGNGNDRIWSDVGGGTNWRTSPGGDDFVTGGAGDDWVSAWLGNDIVYGDDVAGVLSGNDTLHLSYGDDVGHGGGGNDTVYGGEGNDVMYGDDGDDLLVGGNGTDRAYGGAGVDTLDGGGDADALFGGAGNDRIDGGEGDDSLTGDAGADTFVFAHSFDHDYVQDFDVDGGDLLDLTFFGVADFAELAANNLVQRGADAELQFDTNDNGELDTFITLVGINDASLGANDFIF